MLAYAELVIGVRLPPCSHSHLALSLTRFLPLSLPLFPSLPQLCIERKRAVMSLLIALDSA